MNKAIALLLVAFSLIFYGVGEYYSKVWCLKPNWSLAILVTSLYAISGAMWLPALRQHGQLSALSAVWSSLSVIICVLLGVFLFHEQLSTRQIIGLVLALFAVILTF